MLGSGNPSHHPHTHSSELVTMLNLPILDGRLLYKNIQHEFIQAYSQLKRIYKGEDPVPYNYLLQYFWIFVSLLGYTYFATLKQPVGEVIFSIIKSTIVCTGLHGIYYMLDVHKRWGPWGVSEPKSHFKFMLETAWIVALFSLGDIARMAWYGMDREFIKTHGRIVLWDIPEKYHYLKSNNKAFDIILGILGFYMVDFLRYWAHRFGHNRPFYKTFPFSHAHHHNQIFLDPLIFKVSPLLHLASLATYTPPLILGLLGNHRASCIAWSICYFPNLTQHLGFDPLPWLTRWNHYYFWGALPWIPLYHCYHHNPFIRDGCYGNTTVFFDYVFDTLQPECIYHIEHGRPMEKVLDRFKDPQKLDRILDSMYHAGKSKARLDLNDEGYDWSMIPNGLEK